MGVSCARRIVDYPGKAMAEDQHEQAQPWHRRKGETGKAWEAFQVYRDLGPTRSANKTAGQLKKAGSLIRAWKLKYDWEERAAAWDRHLEREKDSAWVRSQTAHPDEIAAMNARHAEAALALQQKALLRLAQLDPAQLTPPQVLAYLVEAVKLERTARGEAREEDAAGDDADQDIVVRLLADPDSRRLAAQLAARAGGSNGHSTNGHGR